MHAGSVLQLVAYLVNEREADVDAEDSEGNCPLHLAAANGHLEVVKVGNARVAHQGAERQGTQGGHMQSIST